MKNWKKILAVSGVCSVAFAMPVQASTNLETGSSLAGISVALNNFYAGNPEPEKQLATIYPEIESKSVKKQNNGSSASAGGAASAEGAASETQAAQIGRAHV